MSAEDELAIRNIVADLSRFADDGDLDDYVGLFAPDGVWDMPGATRTGHAEIRAGAEARRAAGGQGPGSNTRHAVTTVAVRVDGDAATSTSTFLFLTGTNEPPPTLALVGTYDDTFVRTPDGWRLASRRISIG